DLTGLDRCAGVAFAHARMAAEPRLGRRRTIRSADTTPMPGPRELREARFHPVDVASQRDELVGDLVIAHHVGIEVVGARRFEQCDHDGPPSAPATNESGWCGPSESSTRGSAGTIPN